MKSKPTDGASGRSPSSTWESATRILDSVREICVLRFSLDRFCAVPYYLQSGQAMKFHFINFYFSSPYEFVRIVAHLYSFPGKIDFKKFTLLDEWPWRSKVDMVHGTNSSFRNRVQQRRHFEALKMPELNEAEYKESRYQIVSNQIFFINRKNQANDLFYIKAR